MRITIGLAMASLCLLAACNKGAANNSAAANATAPAANETAPVAPETPAPGNSAAGPSTPAPAAGSEIQECVSDVANELPSGTDVNAFCTCAVGKMATNGGRERPAMEECAAEMGIQPRQ